MFGIDQVGVETFKVAEAGLHRILQQYLHLFFHPLLQIVGLDCFQAFDRLLKVRDYGGSLMH